MWHIVRSTGYLNPTKVKIALFAEPMLTLQVIHTATQATVTIIDVCLTSDEPVEGATVGRLPSVG